MKEERSPRDLRVRTKEFAIGVVRFYCALPKSTEGQALGRQLLRSGTSVGGQYREAQRAKSKRDFISKIEGSLQELDETSNWLELLLESRIVQGSLVNALRQEAEELTAIFVSIAKDAKAALGKARE
jgi:four helix bundle protein